MILPELLARDEGKTLEFKENCRPTQKILQTVVAFANTAGGTLILGVRDRTKEVVGLSDPLREEERLANIFADNVRPLLMPEIQILSWRDRELIVVMVPHMAGPYYVRSEGPKKGVYIRLGSTNRRAGPEIIAEIQRLAVNTFFDEQPCPEVDSEAVDFRAASEFFAQVSLNLTSAKQRSLNLVINHGGREVPTRGAILLFGRNRRSLFPDAVIRCARFRGTDKSHFLDQAEIDEYLPQAVESAVSFVERHTVQAFEIGRVRRKEIPEYPPPAIREAIINAVVHADYSIGGMSINVAVFDGRIEISNPGLLPFGLTLEAALAGVSKLRNRVIGRVFRELKLIEQWGSGMGRMIAACTEAGLRPPRFEEIGTSFRVTLYSEKVAESAIPEWQEQLLKYLGEKREISTHDAAQIWKISDRAARTRLRKLVSLGILAEIGTGPRDPKKVYVIKGRQNV